MITENYLDEDVGYLLGLLVARGRVSTGEGDPVVYVEFPARSLQARGVKMSFDQEHHVLHNLLIIKDRISATLGHMVSHTMTSLTGTLVVTFPGTPVSFRNLIKHLGREFSPNTSRVPKAIFEAPPEIQTEFLRGFSDCAGFIRGTNADRNGNHRVYLQIPNENWALPIEICSLLQVSLKIPVHTIQWGHPNIRTPNATSSKLWAKEHQLRVYARDFRPIGFYVKYKQAILDELAELRGKGKTSRFCNPNPDVRQIRKKPKHREEKSKDLPPAIRKHFDAYWEICTSLGCRQCRKVAGKSKEVYG